MGRGTIRVTRHLFNSNNFAIGGGMLSPKCYSNLNVRIYAHFIPASVLASSNPLVFSLTFNNNNNNHNTRGRRLAVPAFLDFSLVFNPRDLYYRGF